MKLLSRLSVALGTVVALALLQPVSAFAQIKPAEDVHIVFVTHGQANDNYWSVVKNGIQQATGYVRKVGDCRNGSP